MKGEKDMTVVEKLTYEEIENQRLIRELVLEGLVDIKEGRSRECKEVFDELEEFYGSI